VKEDYRKENELFMENDKAMKKLHEKIIVMEEKCRDIQKKIKEKKGEKPKSQGVPEVRIVFQIYSKNLDNTRKYCDIRKQSQRSSREEKCDREEL